jgi:hypothetical protein
MSIRRAERAHGGGGRGYGVATVGEQVLDEREQLADGGEHDQAAVAILDVGGMDDDLQRQAERIDEHVPLLAFDFLGGVVARGIDLGARIGPGSQSSTCGTLQTQRHIRKSQTILTTQALSERTLRSCPLNYVSSRRNL